MYKTKQLLSSNVPLWSGFMKSVFGEDIFLKKSSVVFLPMIPLRPTDIPCVYSTLKYIENLAINSGRTPVCTFDQAVVVQGITGDTITTCSHWKIYP